MRMGFSDQCNSYLRGAAVALRVLMMATMVYIEGLRVEENNNVSLKGLVGRFGEISL